MKYLKTLVGAAALAVASFNVSASPVSVGGVTWDDVNVGVLNNFTFTQWYTQAAYGSGAEGQSLISSNSAVSFTTPGAALSGVGIFINFNDGKGLFPDFDYCSNGPRCSLTFAFGGLIATAATGNPIPFDTTNAWLNIYFQSTADSNYNQTHVGNLFNNSSAASSNATISYAQSGTLWASFKFDQSILKSDVFSSLQGGELEGLLSIDTTKGLSDVVSELDRQSGTSDLFIKASAAFNSPTSLYSSGGTGQTQVVPEPTSIALLGLGLLGLFGGRRFKKA